MLKAKLRENWQWTGLWLILTLTALYTRPLIPIDETRYLSVAWEMWHSKDFLVPHINGLPYSHKPPLFFWLINFFWLLFGVSEWSGRIIGPLFGFASVFLTIRLGKILWPQQKNVSLAVPFVLLGTLIWSLYTSLTMFDALLTFFCLIALNCILEAKMQRSMLSWIGLSIAIGLGILAKGPIVLLYVLPPILFAPFWSSNKELSWRWWYTLSFISLAAGVAIALCWAIPAAKAGGLEYRQAILFSQTAGRMVESFAHRRPFFWYTLLLPLLFFPWFFWMPVWREWKKNLDNSTRFCLTIILPSFMLLSCVSGKQMHYMLPFLPIAALLIARTITSLASAGRYDHLPLVLIFFVMSIAIFIVPLLSLKGGDREIIEHIPRCTAFVPIACGIFLFFAHSQSMLTSIKIVSGSVIMLFILLHLAIAAPLHFTYDQAIVGKKMQKALSRGSEVAVFPAYLADQFQFSGRLTRPLIPKKSLDEVAAWSQKNKQQFCLIFIKDHARKVWKGKGIARPYKGGNLIFCPAKDFMSNQRNWTAQSKS